MVVINRFLDEKYFKMLLTEKNLLKIVRESKGELFLALRHNYFNIYFEGNSVARIDFKDNEKYDVTISKKFIPDKWIDGECFTSKSTVGDSTITFKIEKDCLYKMLQKKNIDKICKKIDKVNYSEELFFEQMLIADNLDNENVICIDTQITDHKLNSRMDLLVLKNVYENKYKFVVNEIKLGKNDELSGKAYEQLNGYIKHIEEYFDDYKACYEKNYSQQKALDLPGLPQYDNIEIIPDVDGEVIVLGYSKSAKEKVEKLHQKYPDIKVRIFDFKL